MKVVNEYPPNYADIAAVFNIKAMRGIVFTYGDTIYNPDHGKVSEHLMTHEEVHEKQQAAMGVKKWWKQYLVDPEFRLSQELEAYRAQYQFLQTSHNRQQRKAILLHISKDLAGAMYGHILTKDKARELITGIA